MFRGRRKNNGKWVDGFMLRYHDKAYICSSVTGLYNYYENQYFGAWVKVDYDTIGEYTGLTDKNDVKIFENDILCDTCGDTPKIYSVIWADGAFMIRLKGGCCFSLNALNVGEFEVVGNIHDNPELIGGTS